ncbi:(2Fe-2S)-binding protein [Ornithinimicrobium cryptoxanthini]|uniref:(2Fe-2S)-binding protein n=1 Tax=Ornithinimicrobium cryptoxanthini TaxID=2934161 RepID=A0ABY4YES3_9MICO|nr:(2Fe-2S)-binding protein [Ornithinimicrobium cryptoxanthini]USQ75264.1 (2Fe-2S)-binding protein [Ornithinimicrobium cryptoxanthini]
MGGPTRGPAGIPPPAQRAAELTELGGFAVWQVDTGGLVPVSAALEAEPLAGRFAATRAGLASGTGLATDEVMVRTAVSAAQVGLVSRLWSIALASVALHGWVPQLTMDQLLVAPTHRNPAPMALVDATAGVEVTDPAHAAHAIGELVVHGAVAGITHACRVEGRTAPRVLVSNAASSLVAAARVIGRKVPDQAAQVDEVARLLLQTPWLAAGGGYQDVEDAPDTDPVEEFKRTGCCLYYRLPGHGLCPDCVLVRPGHPADTDH